MPILTTYAGSGVSCVLTSNEGLFPPIAFGGIAQTGLAEITVRMTVDHASIQGGMDGAPFPSWTPGEWGELDASVWQTSTTQQQFVTAYNAILASTLAGEVSGTFTNTMIIQDIITGTIHTATGVAFPKISDKPYGSQGAAVRWTFKACNIITESPSLPNTIASIT